MPDTPTVKNPVLPGATAEPAVDLAKAGALIVGILYGLGFLVVTLHLSRYHVLPFGLLRVQYLLAGIWVLVPLTAVVLPLLWVAAVLHDQYRKGHAPGHGRLWRTVLHVMKVGTAIMVSVGWLGIMHMILRTAAPELVGPLGEIDNIFLFRYAGIVLLYAIGIAVTISGAWIFFRDVVWSDVIASANDILWGVMSASFAFVLSLAYVFHFSTSAYPRLPAVLGGGAPVKVFLLDKEEVLGSLDRQLSAPINKNQAYDMLLETDHAYVLLSSHAGSHVTVMNKDGFGGMLFARSIERAGAR